jgi:hypothetical protein
VIINVYCVLNSGLHIIHFFCPYVIGLAHLLVLRSFHVILRSFCFKKFFVNFWNWLISSMWSYLGTFIGFRDYPFIECRSVVIPLFDLLMLIICVLYLLIFISLARDIGICYGESLFVFLIFLHCFLNFNLIFFFVISILMLALS